ncbi:MAG TPA: MFS transporter [Patescibacteria group bacterium]|nr:MFS transporter [Patescibacteria group bacterium]
MEGRLNYKNTFLLGFGFFCISIVWPLYNAFVPVFLSKYLSSALMIGFVMTFDNIAAITLQPFFGALSDRTKTKFGRRMPYLMVGIPLSALFFTLIPVHFSLISLIAIAMGFNIMMSIYRAPTVALMPDLTPSANRSKANGIINLMGGLGAVLALFVGPMLYDINKLYPFAAAAVIMIIALLILLKTIREPEKLVRDDEEHTGIIKAFFEVVKDKDRSALLILVAIFLWFVAYQGVEALFTLYGVKYLGLKESTAAFLLSFFSLTFLLFAIPSGFIATKVGRRKTIMTGITGLLIVFILITFFRNTTYIAILLGMGGIFWALININSYPMVVEMTTESKIGAYTGLYYFFSSLAAITGPPLLGFIIDYAGYGSLFLISVFFLLLALVTMMFVKKGESKDGINQAE